LGAPEPSAAEAGAPERSARDNVKEEV